MKISEITIDSVKEYCGISSNDSDVILTACLASAKAYAVGFTGCALAELEEYEDVSLAIMMLANDYFYSDSAVRATISRILQLKIYCICTVKIFIGWCLYAKYCF